jgi:hypothetical protein
MSSNETRKLKKSSKKSSKKSKRGSKKSHRKEEETEAENDMYQPNDMYQANNMYQPQQENMNNLNQLQNPYNLEYDPLHVNYIVPSYNNLNLNNYGVSFDQLTSGPQHNSLNSSINKNSSAGMGPGMSNMPPMGAPPMGVPNMPPMGVPNMPPMGAPSMTMGMSPLQMGGSRRLLRK